MNQAKAWIVQVESDFAAGDRVFKSGETATYCQAIAKYQQVTEKSVKAMVAAIVETGAPFNSVQRFHDPTREIDALRTIARSIDVRSIDHVQRIFTKKRRDEIHSLCSLAPIWPADGQSFAKNTEYPFLLADGSWTAPAAAGNFSEDEVSRYRTLAWELRFNVARFVENVRRRKPS